jgi:peptidyl-prolyl cis-trans isomerase C
LAGLWYGRVTPDEFERISMSPRNRWRLLAQTALVWLVVTNGLLVPSGQAQTAQSPDPSPFAPGDLKRPIFDTQTPSYNVSNAEAKSANTVVAEVDGRAITLGDVGDAIAALPPKVRGLPFADIFPGVLAQLVGQQALVIRAHNRGVDEDPVVRRKIKAASDRVLVNALLEQEISGSITEESLLARYKKDFVDKPPPEEVHVRVIMTQTEQEATNIIAELRAGADFATLAKRSSTDATALAGGDAGFVTLDSLTPAVGAVVFSMQAGQFTQFPMHSAGGWFVLKAEERRRSPIPAFSTVRERLRQAMLQEGVPNVLRAAMADVTVREFDVTGKETNGISAPAKARTPR